MSAQGTDRLVLFTDAVVAIAITLLVLPLVDAATEAVDRGAPSVEVITGNQAAIYSFLLSFVVIARLWTVHHRLFDGVDAASRAVVLWNMAWVFTIVVLPFVTELIGGYGDQFTAAVYVGTILASSVCLSALSVLVRGGLTPAASSASGLLVVALLLVLLIPGIRYFALLVLLLSSPVERIWLRWRPAAARA